MVHSLNNLKPFNRKLATIFVSQKWQDFSFKVLGIEHGSQTSAFSQSLILIPKYDSQRKERYVCFFIFPHDFHAVNKDFCEEWNCERL